MIGFGFLNNLIAAARRKVRASAANVEAPRVLVFGKSGAAPTQSTAWSVCTADTLAEARKLAADYEIAVALCDRDAPGIEWRRAVQELAHTQSHPCVVLLTGTEDWELWEQVTAAGGYDVVRKPVSAETLSRVIGAGISHWRSRQALDAERVVPIRK